MEPQLLSSDIISTLPPSIIETILCLVPIKEAARTSILSKEWRCKWTKIPKLVFDAYMFKESTDDENHVSVLMQIIARERKKMGRRFKLFHAIYQVLLMRQGPIHEFTLQMEADKTCVEIDTIISYLSRNNTVKKLKLDLLEEQGWKYMLPSSIFLWHHLTDLHFCDCNLDFQPTFSGFARLTSLYLMQVYVSTKTLLHLLSNSPLLKHFTLIIDGFHLVGDANSTILELFKCLPVIEDLSISGDITECFVIDSVPQDLPTLLINLKHIYVDFMSFNSPDQLHFLALLIRSSPNLEKMKLKIFYSSHDDGMISVIHEAYSDIWLEHLKELDINCLSNLNPEMEFVKFILAKSPKLKKVGLCFKGEIDMNEPLELVKFIIDKSPKLKKVGLCFEDVINENEELEMLRILLKAPPASPSVEFIVYYVLKT